ncbi:MAG: choice-of-anchor I family protein [Chloroflexota bacterium]
MYPKRLIYATFFVALCLLMLAGTIHPASAQDVPVASGAVKLSILGTYETGLTGKSAAEIVSYDPIMQRAFTVNAADSTIDVIDLSDPTNPTVYKVIDIAEYGKSANSVDIYDGVAAVAIENADKQTAGVAVFFDYDGEFISQVTVGALPDMLTFTPDGTKVVVANEGEPNDEYTNDPEGTVTIIDVSSGVDNLADENVTHVSFTTFNNAELDPAIRIYGPEATVAQDLEPEYVAVSADSSTAWVSLQENNALAVIDLIAGEATALIPLGYKNMNAPIATLETFEFELPTLGTTPAGEEVLWGGFSGLYFEGIDEETGKLNFITHPDRGPTGDTIDVDDDGVNERPFVLPDFQSSWVRFSLDHANGTIEITEVVGLTQADGTPISGLPNLAGEKGMAYADEEPIDLSGNLLDLDPFGGDMEGIVQAEDGTYWMVDEYRPAIYHFDGEGVLIDRFVPEGSNDEENGITVGTEAIPAVFAQRRANRGMEAVALEGTTLYAFIQSPIDNPDTSGDTNSRASNIVRILAFDTTSGTTIGQYIYMLEGGSVDKIGDAVSLGDGEFLVIERDSATGPSSQKYIFKISLDGATNLEEMEGLPIGPDGALERQGLVGLAMVGIKPVQKDLYVDLAAIGYHQGDKPEGLALIDENTIAVLNDNDFGLLGGFDIETGLLDPNPNPGAEILGIITLHSNGMDASNRDEAINIQNWPVMNMYQPDSIAAYEVDGETYIITANEGDARDYDGYSEEARVADLFLDWSVFPNALELQKDENLGRLKTTTSQGDIDGDGLHEIIYGYGGRSFTIWNSSGDMVFDSGDQFARIMAKMIPEGFNADGNDDSFDDRSDDKGGEPEAMVLGVIGDATYVFIGLERASGIMVYDVTSPYHPEFVQYIDNRNFEGKVIDGTAGDLAPEGIEFVSAVDSPTGVDMLIVANEFSGTVTMYGIR